MWCLPDQDLDQDLDQLRMLGQVRVWQQRPVEMILSYSRIKVLQSQRGTWLLELESQGVPTGCLESRIRAALGWLRIWIEPQAGLAYCGQTGRHSGTV